MDIRITPKKLSGAVTPPPSKSMAHRYLIAMMLAGQEDTLPAAGESQDISATRRCLAALKGTRSGELPHLDCGESGSTLRFLIPIALALTGGGHFTGQGHLMDRPQQPYFDIFEEKGIAYRRAGSILTVRGTLTAGVYSLPGNVSSQFVTGLLYALPLLSGDSEIRITSPLESRGYVDMTLDTLKTFGVNVDNLDYERFRVPGGQIYRAQDVTVETDWSQAAFWYAALALGSQLELKGLNPFSCQGDMVIVPHYLRLTQPGDVEIDISECPDLLPPLAVMAAVRSGTTRFINAARLRIKESDRLTSVHAMLTTLGGRAEEGADSLTVIGGPLTGGTVDGANDHRIVMAAAIAATACTAPVTVLGAEAVSKSYPDFFDVYKQLGGDFCVL